MQQNQLELVKNLLTNLQSNEPSVREPAELQFKTFFSNNTQQAVTALSQASLLAENSHARTLSVILLRRHIFSAEDGTYDRVDESVKKSLKAMCLQSLEREPEVPVRRQIISLSTAIAENDLKIGRWPELFPALEGMCKSANSVVRGDTFFLFGSISSIGALKKSEKVTFLNIFATGLQDVDLDVRIKSFEAFISFGEMLEDDEKNLNPGVMNSILKLTKDVIETRDPQFTTVMLESLIDFATVTPDLLKFHFEDFVKIMAGVAMGPKFEGSERILAMEFLVQLAEEDHGFYRRSSHFVTMSFMSALSLMMEILDLDNWLDVLDEDEWEEEEMYVEGETAMDRLAQAFGSERTVSVAMPMVMNFLQDPNWKKRVVALISISQMGESIDETHLTKLVSVVSSFFNDANPRVTFSAIHCIGQMCDDFAPDIQRNFHAVIMPQMVKILKTSPYPKIQSHAGAALVNFVENIDSDVLALYLRQLMPILFELMTNSQRVVQEQVVTVVASMASSVPKQFHKDLEQFVKPFLRFFLECKTTDQILLKCKCLEALSFIGTEIGQSFGPVAHELMKLTLAEVNEVRKHNVDYFDFVLQAWIRLIKILKEEFARYLPVVMPLLFETLSEEDSVNPHSRHDADSDEDDEDYYKGTAFVNELESATCAMSVLPLELKQHFLPYLQPSLKAMEEMLSYWSNDNVQTYAARAHASIYSVVSQAALDAKIGVDEAVTCLETFYKRLIKAYVDAIDPTIRKNILTSITEMFEENEQVTVAYMTKDSNLSKVLKTCCDLIKLVKATYEKIESKKKLKDIDEEQKNKYSQYLEYENELIFRITEVFGTVLKVMKDGAIVVFNGFFDSFMVMLSNKESHIIDKKAVLLIIDDAISFIPAAMEKYAMYLFHMFINFLEIEDIEIRQASIYGLGLLIENFPKHFLDKSAEVLEICAKLFAVLKNAGEKTTMLRENAAAAYARVAFACAERVDLEQSFPVLLSMLPLQKDMSEICKTTDLLVSVVETGNTKCLGNDLKHFTQILNILGSNVKLLPPTEAQKKGLGGVVNKVKALNAEAQNSLAGQITPEAKEMLSLF